MAASSRSRALRWLALSFRDTRGRWAGPHGPRRHPFSSSSGANLANPANSANSANAASRPGDDQPHRAARVIAALFMASAAYTVFPLVPSALVEHTIKLMRTDQPFLQDAGMSRLQWLARFEPARRRARELGAVEVVEAMGGNGESTMSDGWEARRRALLDALNDGTGERSGG